VHTQDSKPFQERLERMESEVQSLKEEVNAKSEELDVRLRCLHEFQMSTNQKHFAHAGENKAELRFGPVLSSMSDEFPDQAMACTINT
jgi:hypothetical protein